MKVLFPMRQALSDAQLLAGALPGESWAAWRILLIAAAGERLTRSERKVFKRVTGRDREPGNMVELFLGVIGRRGGKSKAMAVFMTWLATCVDWSDCLSIGERGVALIVAPTERQAAVTENYIRAIIDSAPLLSSLVEDRTQHVLQLKRSVCIEVLAANAKWVRGITAIGICLDECAYLPSNEDAANSDISILEALRPTTATTSGPILLTSSPSTTTGVVHSLWQKFYGKPDRFALVVQSDTRGLNPMLRQSVIDRAYEQDSTAAQREFGAEFAEPLSQYISRELVERCVEKGMFERQPLPGVQYVAYVDCASGTGSDAFALCIGHRSKDKDRNVVVIDLLIGQKPPFNPLELTKDLAARLKQWGLRECMGDNWAGGFPASVFQSNGITFANSPLTTSELYLHSLPAWTSQTVLMLDMPAAIEQIVSLRRKIGQAGKESVQHMRGQHDDLANVIAGVIYRLTPVEGVPQTFGGFGVVTQPRVYEYEKSSEADDTMAAWKRSSGQTYEIGKEGIHKGVPIKTSGFRWP